MQTFRWDLVVTDKKFIVTYTIVIQGVTDLQAENEDEALDIVEGWDISDFGDFNINSSEVDLDFEIEESQEK